MLCVILVYYLKNLYYINFNGYHLPDFLNLKNMYLYFMCRSVLLTWMYVNCLHTWCLQRLEEVVGHLRTGDTMVVNHHLTSGNWMVVLCKNSKLFLTTKPLLALAPSFFSDNSKSIYLPSFSQKLLTIITPYHLVFSSSLSKPFIISAKESTVNPNHDFSLSNRHFTIVIEDIFFAITFEQFMIHLF